MKPKVLRSEDLIKLLINALNQKTPFSVVSVGVTESFVLAQYSILTEGEFMGHKEAYVAAQGATRGFDHRGIRFPNTEARDLAAAALKKADVIGYSMISKDMDTGKIVHTGEFAERVFAYYQISPEYVFDANIRRVIMFSQQEKFEKMLAKRKILLICNYADEVKTAMENNLKSKLGLEVTGIIKIQEFEEIPRVKDELARVDFDLCLLAAGINAVILGPYIAMTYRKVAFDLGQAMESFISGKIEMSKYLDTYIGLDYLISL